MSRLKLKPVAAAGVFLMLLAGCGKRGVPDQARAVSRPPVLKPDYCGITIPPNIAPLSFRVAEAGSDFRVRISGDRGEALVVASRAAEMIIPSGPWHELLEANRGKHIRLDVYAREAGGAWVQYESLTNSVAAEPIDSHLVYRLLGSLCNQYERVGIYQRNLETFDESVLIDNQMTGGGCVNCHSFKENDPSLFSFHVRPSQKHAPHLPAAMILVRDDHAKQLNTRSEAAPGPPGYISWRNDGRAVAFALGKPRQIFRSYGAEIRDVFDLQSNLAIADAETGAASTTPSISPPENLETFPCWSADGKTLYYSCAATLWGDGRPINPDRIKQTRFDLMRISYDIDSDTWGQPQPVLTAAETGKSIVQPRTSPDGKYLLFCMADYGGFPVNQESSDLYLMDLKTGKTRRLTCSSDQSESWHSWSSNSRWIVCSSKRLDGLFVRPWICYIDENGREHKPFVLPQKDPDFYDTCLTTYNLPELVNGAITVSSKELLSALQSDETPDDSAGGELPAIPWDEGGYGLH